MAPNTSLALAQIFACSFCVSSTWLRPRKFVFVTRIDLTLSHSLVKNAQTEGGIERKGVVHEVARGTEGIFSSKIMVLWLQS